MPAWVIPFLIKYVLPVVIEWLQKEGFFDAAEALAAKGGIAIYSEVKTWRASSAPSDFPCAPNPNPSKNNLTPSQPTE